jgi:probable rRNA maturation factor
MRVTVHQDEGLTGEQRAWVRDAALGTLLRACGTTLQVGPRAGLALRLTGDGELHRLNHSFLGTDAPTDVLAFPGGDPGHVGDIAISVERAAAQSDDPVAELRLLAVHGLLHCIGHDHADAEGAAEMTRQTRLLLPGQVVPELVA